MPGVVAILVIPLIGAALGRLLTLLASHDFLQLFKKRGLELKHLTELKFLLLVITAVLTDAEEKEITNPSVNLWIDELKDAVYEAEDVLDEISTTTNQASNSDLRKKVEGVISRLKSIAEHKDVLGLKGRERRTSSTFPTSSLVSEPEILGREDDRRAILKFLLPDGGNEKEITNPSVNLWIDELKDAVYEAGDVLDEISTTTNQASNSDLRKKVEGVISRLKSIAEHKDVLGLKGRGRRTSSTFPTSSLVSEPEILGREDDRRAILKFLLPDGGNENEILMNSSNISVEIPNRPADEEREPVLNENGYGPYRNPGTVAPREGGAPVSSLPPSENDAIFVVNEDEVAAANRNEAPADDVEIMSVDGNGTVTARENRVPWNQDEVGAEGNQRDRKEISVIAIIGMPGVGKTTLAQDLFNRVKNKFHLTAWVHVSEEFDLLEATKVIHDNITSCNRRQLPRTVDFSTLQVRIQEASKGKKVLLVLDDVWNENFEDLDALKRPFRDVASGSVIILTSRNAGVASITHAVHIHSLSYLSDDDCWSLFMKHAGKNGEDYENPEIKGRIVKKCKGLPLAAKTFGALLKTKAEIDEWNDVLNSKLRDIPSDKCNILPILRLSYYHLPFHLKCCFAFCSIFPKGYQIEKGNLVRLWMAQGLVMQQKNKRREEVGDEYFRELLSRSFFQQFGRQDKPYFMMHDLFNDLARDVAGEFCFNFEDGIQNDIAEKIRHFSFLAEEYEVPEKFDSFKFANHLRTFLPLKLISSQQVCVLSDSALKSLLKASNHLRVISLSPYAIHKLDDSIGSLKYLRYLDLSRSLIKFLPESVSSLYKLETLLLLECRQLTDLPKQMKKLANLQHLNIQKTKLNRMPEKIGRLKNLHVLTDFVVGDTGSTISELKELSDLGGALSILNLEKVDRKHADVANLKGKKYLTELVFQWTNGIHDNVHNNEGVLAALEPGKNLKKLSIKNYGGRTFQTWLGDASFSKMVYLCLDGCENCSSLPSLGQLSSLKELYIANMKNVATVDSQFCGSTAASLDPFKSLEILKFENMPIWSTFNIKHLLPSLQKLHLHNCPKLTKSLPTHLPSLDRLYISQCPALELEFLEKAKDKSYGMLKNLEVRSSCNFLLTFSFDCTTKLENLTIHGFDNLEKFQYSSDCPISLKFLEIQDCPKLEIFPVAETLSNLQSLSVKNCTIPQADWGLHNMEKLNCLEIEGKCVGVKSFPVEGLLPVNLDSLRISGFIDLLSFRRAAFEHLTRLGTLEIDDCGSLNCISHEQLPLSLTCLTINECPSLENRCRRGGEDWDKLCHIRNITIDGEEISLK